MNKIKNETFFEDKREKKGQRIKVTCNFESYVRIINIIEFEGKADINNR